MMGYNMKFEKILEYVKNSPWPDDSEYEIIVDQAHKVYEDITKGKDKDTRFYRICGQTGSGKTTQLLKSLEMYMEFNKKKPVVLGVRTCASYHPYYKELLEKHGNGNIREVTNGFALKCMIYVLKLLIENHYLILLDITLLDPIYEEYVLDLVKENSYVVEYHIMAVNKAISDSFIIKRLKTTGRVVKKESSEFLFSDLNDITDLADFYKKFFYY